MNRKSLLCLFVSFFIFGLVSVSVADDPPVACFTADVLTGDIPLLVSFTDASAGEISTWEWDFGDESPFSYLQNPTHTYTSPGTFVVTLTVTGPGGSSYATCEIVAEAPLVACFTTESTPGTFPVEVSFIDESIGNIETWEWDFGDGSAHSYEQNPTHTYTTAGTYIVILEITDYYSNTATATCEVSANPVWIPNDSGHISGSNASGEWKVALVSVGFKSVETSPDKWNQIHRDITQTVYTSDPYSNYQWWDKTIAAASPDDWPDGDAEDWEIDAPIPQPAKDQKFPICYTSGSHMQVKLLIKVSGSPNIERFRGYQPNEQGKYFKDSYYFPSVGYTAGNDIILVCSKAFPSNKVTYIEELKIQWMVRIDGKWGNLTSSKNQCYVTLADPNMINDLYHTTAHIACKYGDGETTLEGACDKIYTYFKTREVKNYTEQDPDGKLFYWGSYVVPPPATPPTTPPNDVVTTEDLLKHKDGVCDAWQDFYNDIMHAHGCSYYTKKKIKPKTYISGGYEYNGQFIYVKEWTFADGTTRTEPIQGTKLPAQNNTNPDNRYTFHQINKIGSYYYDSSYGSNKKSSHLEYADAYISGIQVKEPLSGICYWVKNTENTTVTEEE